MKLNKALILLISLIQAYIKYNIDFGILNDSHGDSKIDWYSKANEYYYSLDDKYFDAAGIIKNEWYFKQIIHFDISNEIDRTKYDQLDKFIFPEESKYKETIVSSFFYYMWNAWDKSECQKVFGWEYNHFWSKWVHFTKDTAWGAAEKFYAELCHNNREKLVNHACLIYDGNRRKEKNEK